MSRVPVTMRDLFWTDPFFERAWGTDDFDLLRREMLHEHQRMWDRFDHEFLETSQHCPSCGSHKAVTHKEDGTKMEDGTKKEDRTVAERGDDIFRPWFMPPRHWLRPALRFGEEFERSMNEASQLMRVKEDDTKFEVSLDTHEFRPDELKINVNDNLLTIEGMHEEKSEEGTNYAYRNFKRKYTLPRGCEAKTVNSNLSSDGVLMITAPKNPALTHADRAIPIQMQEHKK